MSEGVSHDTLGPERASGVLSLLVLLVLVSPHTLEFSRYSLLDSSSAQYTFAAAFWTFIHEEGFGIIGPYSFTQLQFVNELSLLWTALFMPLYLCIIYVQWQFMQGKATKARILYVIFGSLAIQMSVLLAFFSYSLDGWASTAAYPLPVFHVLSSFVVLRHSELKQGD